MNDLHTQNRHDVITNNGEDRPAVNREVERASTHRPHLRHRWGGRVFAICAFSLLTCGLSLGAWANYSRQQQVMATARQERDFVPSLPVATVEASPATVSVTLPGTTAAFAAANIYARATGYIAKRNVDIGDRVKAGDVLAELAVPELDDQISQNEAILDQLKAALEPGGGQPKSGAGDLEPRQRAGREGLGDPAARRRRCPQPQGAGSRSGCRAT
jgi:multidrug efflux pump subunit AcrA (membrane-fusion protein)